MVRCYGLLRCGVCVVMHEQILSGCFRALSSLPDDKAGADFAPDAYAHNKACVRPQLQALAEKPCSHILMDVKAGTNTIR